MPSLSSISTNFRSEFVTEDGRTILGTIYPVEVGRIPSYDFTPARQIFRTTPHSEAEAGMVITDVYDRKLLLGDLGLAAFSGSKTYKTFRLFEMNQSMHWTRETVVVDSVTGIERSSGVTDLGYIWAANELNGREELDRTLKIKEDISRVITGANLQLGDYLDNRIVRRMNIQLGVRVAEIA